MKRLTLLSILPLAALSACAPTTISLQEFNARNAEQRAMSQGLENTLAQPPVRQKNWTRGAVR